MNKEISILSQTYKVLSNAAPPQGETAAREFYEGLKALEYAVWCLENSQEVAMGSPKQVIRIFPEFYLVEFTTATVLSTMSQPVPLAHATVEH